MGPIWALACLRVAVTGVTLPRVSGAAGDLGKGDVTEMLRRGATMLCAAVGLVGTLGASTAVADTVEPLTQYVVSGRVNTDALAQIVIEKNKQ